MAISNIGTQVIVEKEGWTLKKDAYGLDVLTRHYNGPQSDLRRWLSTHRPGKTDASYIEDAETDRIAFGDLLAIEINVGQVRGGVVNPSIIFKGVLGGLSGAYPVTEEQLKTSLVTKTTTLILADGSGRQIEIDYKAPSATWTYARANRPKKGLHRGKEMPELEKAYTIIRSRGAVEFPIEFLTGPATATGVEKYFANTRVYQEEFTAEQQGNAFAVTETNEGLIYDAYDPNTGKSADAPAQQETQEVAS